MSQPGPSTSGGVPKPAVPTAKKPSPPEKVPADAPAPPIPPREGALAVTAAGPRKPPRAASLEEGLLCVLECPVCFEYMVPPIIMCEHGHNICEPCKAKCRSVCPTCRKPLLLTRNIALEQLALTATYPCRNADSGCPLRAPATQMRLHEPSCSYQVFLCPLRCGWRGRRDVLRPHCMGAHIQKTSVFDKSGACVVAWEISQAGCFRDYSHALFAFGEAFLYVKRFIFESRRLAFAVQHIGCTTDTPKFRYKFKLFKEQTKQKLSLSRPVHSHAEDIESLMQTKDCINLDFDTVVSYGKGIRTFQVMKIVPPDQTKVVTTPQEKK